MMKKALTAALLAATLSPAAPAVAHQPMGGCDEAWQAPRSEGAEHCREHGWTVRKRFVLTPSSRVATIRRLKPCEYEDSMNCYWNARSMGNGRGDSFIVIGTEDRHRIWRVKFPR